MTKSEIASAVKRKRKKDPVADRSGKGGKPKMVSNKIGEGYDGKDHEVSMAQSQLDNTIKDAKKLKKSLGKKEKNLPAWMQAKITDTEHNMDAASSYSEEKGPCWTGYKQVGMKKKNGKQVPNCVPESTSPLVKKVLDRHFATEELQQFEEENKPTNPKLWSRAKALAKQKFDVYPSAYANGWASKWYKSKGGGWKSVKEEVEVSEAVTLRSRTGNVYIVSFLFRGKLMMIKLFFPVAKRPSREQVQTAIEGAYPGAKVQRYDVTMVQPGDSYLTPNITAFEEVDHNQELDEDWQKVNKQDKTDGMSPAAVKAYRRENPGSKLKTAVTGDPKPGSKDAKRRKSFCSRSKGQQDMHNIDCSKTPDKAICKARRRWKC